MHLQTATIDELERIQSLPNMTSLFRQTNTGILQSTGAAFQQAVFYTNDDRASSMFFNQQDCSLLISVDFPSTAVTTDRVEWLTVATAMAHEFGHYLQGKFGIAKNGARVLPLSACSQGTRRYQCPVPILERQADIIAGYLSSFVYRRITPPSRDCSPDPGSFSVPNNTIVRSSYTLVEQTASPSLTNKDLPVSITACDVKKNAIGFMVAIGRIQDYAGGDHGDYAQRVAALQQGWAMATKNMSDQYLVDISLIKAEALTGLQCIQSSSH